MLAVPHDEQPWETWRNGVQTRVWSAANLGASGVCVGEQLFVPGAIVPVHWHYSEEVTTVTRGEVEVEVDGETRVFVAPVTFIFPPRSHHGFRNIGDDEMHIIGAFNWPFYETYWDHDPEGVLVREWEAELDGVRRRLGESRDQIADDLGERV